MVVAQEEEGEDKVAAGAFHHPGSYPQLYPTSLYPAQDQLDLCLLRRHQLKTVWSTSFQHSSQRFHQWKLLY